MMRAYRHGSHSVYQCHYHFVFFPKYRKPVLRGEIGLHLRDLVREICKAHDIDLWARGYFVATSGNVTDDVIAKYIAEQDAETDDTDFKVTE